MEAVTHGQPACLSAGKEKQTPSATCSNQLRVPGARGFPCPQAGDTGDTQPASLSLLMPIAVLAGTGNVGFGAFPPTAARVCRCLKVWRVCWCLPSLHEFAAVGMHQQLIPSPHTQQISQSRSAGATFPWGSRSLRQQNCSGHLIQQQNCTHFPGITSPCLAELVSSIASCRVEQLSPLQLRLACQGCHQHGTPMPCTPGKEKGSIIEEAGRDFDLSPSQHACCSARLLPFLSCSCLLSNYSAKCHDVGPQLASLAGTVLDCQGCCR